MTYKRFLKAKTEYDYNYGFDIDIKDINKKLFDWQKAVTKWSIKKGRAALFEGCGAGKTFQSIEWLKWIMQLSKDEGIGLIICPLSVAEQSIEEAKKLGYTLTYVQSGNECILGNIYITNYERIDAFKNIKIKGLVLDESSILKSDNGKTKNKILKIFKDVKYKLSCTATPDPNDIAELGNQVEFLGIMTRKEMLSKFFVNDSKAGKWRLKGHSKDHFYMWMASWAVFIRKPSDIGFSDEGYILPSLNIEPLWVDAEFIPEGELFPVQQVKGIQGRLNVRRLTLNDKIKILAEKVNSNNEQWVIFCKLNDESKEAAKYINGAVEVKGSDSPDIKNQKFLDFKHGKIRVLVTKPKMGGFGMNFQNAHFMAFVGLDDSFEWYYQCIRREYRFGQRHPVWVWIILTNAEQVILNNVLDKENETNILYEEVVKHTQDFTKQQIEYGEIKVKDKHEIKIIENGYYKAIKGDVVETIKKIKNKSVHMEIFSPPFFSLFTYSPSPRDMGNNNNDKEFWNHFDYLIDDLYRVLMDGRICAVHCMDVPSTLVNDGYIGTKDLRGDIIRYFSKHGFIWDGCAVIPKNPQAQSIRTHSKGLTFTQFEKDSSWSRPALFDYLIKFRKPGENKIPVENGDGKEVSRDRWIDFAGGIWRINMEAEITQKEFEELNSGVWESVRETYTLNTIKYENDEKHMCPLQLDTIHNAIVLWTNPGETILSPFAGIGSEGYQAILDGRKAILHELKPEYYDQMIKNLDLAIEKVNQNCLEGFDLNSESVINRMSEILSFDEKEYIK